MKLLIALFLAAVAAFGQVHNYSATSGDVVLSGAGTALTLQQPATNARLVTLNTAVVYCSVACNFSQAQNGAAATATAGTAVALNPGGPAAIATVWTASNVGTGTATGGIYHLAAAQTVTLDLSALQMGNSGTGTNYTITISSISGTANVTLYWSER